MNLSEEQKTALLGKLSGFFDESARSEKEKFDASVFRLLYKQFLRENAVIDWNSWKHIDEQVKRDYEELPVFSEDRTDILDRLVVVKLNGGLGTTMGCSGPKSFIKVKGEQSFLDLAIQQQEMFNSSHPGHPVPLYLMNSFYTDDVTKPMLPGWVKTFDQARCPRLDAESLLPVRDSETAEEESWYPPGHGNIFQSLLFTGLLDELIQQGRDIMFVSNIDNTGANLDMQIAQFVADVKADYVMECTKKTENDKKGGTLIDIQGQLMHLEMPQVPEDRVEEFCSTETFSIFNTNNIWVNLRAVKRRIQSAEGLTSEIIVNKKNLNGRPIIQLETSIGGCIRNFPKAYCVNVGRHRFLPVKKTDDLLAISSSLYEMTPFGTLKLARDTPAPVVSLGKYCVKVADFHDRFPHYPNMLEMTSLSIEGDVEFGRNITLKGDVTIVNKSGARVTLPDNSTYSNETVEF